MIADTYHDRLQNVLEQRDGPAWLDALNQRRHVSMARDGKSPPRPYEFLEPRAVLNCLAYDPAGLQLISEDAATKARQLSGLVNERTTRGRTRRSPKPTAIAPGGCTPTSPATFPLATRSTADDRAAHGPETTARHTRHHGRLLVARAGLAA